MRQRLAFIGNGKGLRSLNVANPVVVSVGASASLAARALGTTRQQEGRSVLVGGTEVPRGGGLTVVPWRFTKALKAQCEALASVKVYDVPPPKFPITLRPYANSKGQPKPS